MSSTRGRRTAPPIPLWRPTRAGATTAPTSRASSRWPSPGNAHSTPRSRSTTRSSAGLPYGRSSSAARGPRCSSSGAAAQAASRDCTSARRPCSSWVAARHRSLQPLSGRSRGAPGREPGATGSPAPPGAGWSGSRLAGDRALRRRRARSRRAGRARTPTPTRSVPTRHTARSARRGPRPSRCGAAPDVNPGRS